MSCSDTVIDSSIACPTQGIWGRRIVTAALVAMALLSNYFHIPILFGVDFIFGSVISLVAAAWMGWRSALVVAIAGSLITWNLWHHPYYIFLASCEAIFVAVTFRRFWDNVLVASTIFWLIPGALIFAIFYGVLLQLQPSAMLMLYLKQVINATFNALIASGLLLAITLFRRPNTRIPLQQACFNTLVAIVFVPALAIVVAISNSRVRTSQSNLLAATSSQAENIVHFLEIWRSENLNVVNTLANVATHHKLMPSGTLQRELGIIHDANQRFADMYMANAEATTIAFDPATDFDGNSLIGINFADREYFHDVRQNLAPVVSNVFTARGGIDFPIVCFVMPILTKNHVGIDKFRGYVLASVDARRLNQTLRTILADDSFKFSVVDRQGQIVTSSVDGIASLDKEAEHFGPGIDSISQDSYRKSPKSDHRAAYALWQATIFGTVRNVPSLGWRVRVEAPLGKFMTDAESFYMEGFAQLLSLTLAGMCLSFLAVVWVSSPIQTLAKSTRDISQHPLSARNLKWPRTPFTEISELVDNFQSMANSLHQRFVDLNKEVEERKDAERRLQIAMEHAQAASVAKSAFLANMSHEIRTPLSAIIGYSELLAREKPAEPEYLGFIDALLRNGKQLSQLVDDILDLSKIEAGHLKLLPEWIDINDIIAGGIDVLSQRALSKCLDFRVIGEGKFPNRIFVDPVRVKQVLLNVVGNAIKFTDHGHVEVKIKITPSATDTADSLLSVLISDTGPGVAISENGAIFEPFVQADSSYSRRHGGTGLGLTLSKTLTKALGGDINLVKSRLGVGSVFAVTFKIKTPPQNEWLGSLTLACSRAPQVKPTTEHEKPLINLDILLVEDSTDNRALISRMLVRYGALVVCASGGEDGVRLAREKPWDIILMDMQMPGLDGYHATKILREGSYKGPIIALTAHALNEEQEFSLQAGCDAHVTKPINWEYLVAVVTGLARTNGRRV
ncbi:MAG: response regulator [Deltaproteobacteria bacterium]|nr:response regulator [Deltaproteobacteria bacterium]